MYRVVVSCLLMWDDLLMCCLIVMFWFKCICCHVSQPASQSALHNMLYTTLLFVDDIHNMLLLFVVHLLLIGFSA